MPPWWNQSKLSGTGETAAKSVAKTAAAARDFKHFATARRLRFIRNYAGTDVAVTAIAETQEGRVIVAFDARHDRNQRDRRRRAKTVASIWRLS